jgi:hypothetical protein
VPAPPPPPDALRLASNASAPNVTALSGPPARAAVSSSSTWLAAARAVASAATPMAQASALANAYGSVVTIVNFTLRDNSAHCVRRASLLRAREFACMTDAGRAIVFPLVCRRV